MCGIAGILNWRGDADGLRTALERMQAAQHHRGPDDRGLWHDPKAETGFTHNRLSILDLSSAGRQPMTTADGRFTITFNGEIYNFRAMRGEMQAAGEVFRSQTDTEVILAMYQRCGASCLRELQGMYAFAIWDQRERTCFLARDPLGIKPLYLHEAADGCFVFASEMRALLVSGIPDRRLSPAALNAFFLYGSVPEPDTMVAGVRRLEAGHHLLWRAGKLQIRQYWEVSFMGEPMPEPEAVTTVRAALEDSVARHFVSDVPVGIFLSGGIDSTALLALASRQGRSDLRTFCISFDDPAYDEGTSANRTACYFGARHTDKRLGAEEGKTLLRQFLMAADHPSVDGFNTYCVSKHANECGLKVVLSGLGGDELFAGYPTFSLVPKLVRSGRWAAMTGPVGRFAGRSVESLASSPRGRRLGSFLTGPPSTASAYWCARGIFTPREAAQLTRHYLGTEIAEVGGVTHFHVPPQPTMADEVSWLELTLYMRNQLLPDSDVMSMASGLELRVPFVDAPLIETIRRIPAALRLAPGKRLLCAAVPELPAWVLNQPKRGFRFPFQEWMQEEWVDVFDAIETGSPVRLQSWYRRWCLFALEDFLSRNSLKP